jgi:prepilin-type N-terminal cleavage/methylation domain-containing protein
MRNDRGFTLIELMVVVVIIGILVSLAVPRFSLVSHQAKVKEGELILKHIYQAQMTWITFAGEPTDELGDLESVGYSAPHRMEYYEMPTAANEYGLPLCLISKQPDAWPSMRVDADGILSEC